MANSGDIKKILADFCRKSTGCVGAAAMNSDGMILASHVQNESDEIHFTAMLSGVLGIGERAVKELNLGELENVVIAGKKGIAVLSLCSEDRALMVVFNDSARLGLTLLDVRELAMEI